MAFQGSNLYYLLWYMTLGWVTTSLGIEVTRPGGGKPLYTVLGANFTIECMREDVGPVAWYIKGIEVSEPHAPGLKVKTTSDGYQEHSTLTKIEVTEADLGIYSCEAASQTASVTVKLLDLQTEDGLVAKPRESGWLHCSDPTLPQGSDTYTIQWLREGYILDNDDRYKIHPENGSLEILKVDYTRDLGEYTCQVLDPGRHVITEEVVNLTAIPHVHSFKERSQNLKRGSELKLECKADGYPMPRLYWKKDEEPLGGGEDTHVVVSEDGQLLTIASVNDNDRGEYYCFGDSGEGRVANASIMVRVKDPLAPLWPFLGIVVEVAILAVIIFFYERNKARRRAEEEQKGEKEALTGGNNGDKNAGASRAASKRDDIEMRKRNT